MATSEKDVTNIHININDEPIERVNKYKYLGCYINETWWKKCRIKQARYAFVGIKNIPVNLNLQLISQIAQCYVFFVLLYGAEPGQSMTSDRRRLSHYHDSLCISPTDYQR